MQNVISLNATTLNVFMLIVMAPNVDDGEASEMNLNLIRRVDCNSRKLFGSKKVFTC